MPDEPIAYPPTCQPEHIRIWALHTVQAWLRADQTTASAHAQITLAEDLAQWVMTGQMPAVRGDDSRLNPQQADRLMKKARSEGWVSD